MALSYCHLRVFVSAIIVLFLPALHPNQLGLFFGLLKSLVQYLVQGCAPRKDNETSLWICS